MGLCHSSVCRYKRELADETRRYDLLREQHQEVMNDLLLKKTQADNGQLIITKLKAEIENLKQDNQRLKEALKNV